MNCFALLLLSLLLLLLTIIIIIIILLFKYLSFEIYFFWINNHSEASRQINDEAAIKWFHRLLTLSNFQSWNNIKQLPTLPRL